MRVPRAPLNVWFYKVSFLDAGSALLFGIQPPWANKLPRNCVPILAMDFRLLVQCEPATSFEQMIGMLFPSFVVTGKRCYSQSLKSPLKCTRYRLTSEVHCQLHPNQRMPSMRVQSFRASSELMVAMVCVTATNKRLSHRWTALFRLHQRPDNDPLMCKTWQNDLFHHTCST